MPCWLVRLFFFFSSFLLLLGIHTRFQLYTFEMVSIFYFRLAHLGQPFSSICENEHLCLNGIPLLILKCTSMMKDINIAPELNTIKLQHTPSIKLLEYEIEKKGTLDHVKLDLVHAYAFLRAYIQHIPHSFIDWNTVLLPSYSFSKCCLYSHTKTLSDP